MFNIRGYIIVISTRTGMSLDLLRNVGDYVISHEELTSDGISTVLAIGRTPILLRMST